MCPIPNGFSDGAISLYSSKIVDKKEILRNRFWYLYLLFKWQSWYSLPSITHFLKFTVNINALCNSCEDMACCSSVQWYSCISETIQNRTRAYALFCLERPMLWPPRILTFSPGTLCIVGDEQTNNILYQCIVSVLWVLITFWCRYVKCIILYKRLFAFDYLCVLL
jgi:hypothetical protein